MNPPKLTLANSPKYAKSKIIEVCKECCISPNSFEVLATEDSNTEENNNSNLGKEFVAIRNCYRVLTTSVTVETLCEV